METTRHFVATVYAVNDGAVALHHHDKLDMWLPPGGHVDRDELPHEAAKRETREEIGQEPELLTPENVGLDSETATAMPRPQHFLLEDINVCDGEVGHQHVDFVYYGRVERREIDPAAGEAPAEAWKWYTPADLDAEAGRFAADVREAGRRAIETVEATE
jgi:ADP-ribose pyrophosphatase YjhB (NUDIX family)